METIRNNAVSKKLKILEYRSEISLLHSFMKLGFTRSVDDSRVWDSCAWKRDALRNKRAEESMWNIQWTANKTAACKYSKGLLTLNDSVTIILIWTGVPTPLIFLTGNGLHTHFAHQRNVCYLQWWWQSHLVWTSLKTSLYGLLNRVATNQRFHCAL